MLFDLFWRLVDQRANILRLVGRSAVAKDDVILLDNELAADPVEGVSFDTPSKRLSNFNTKSNSDLTEVAAACLF
jgi:hypothetical protein